MQLARPIAAAAVDRLAALSDTIALIYESEIDRGLFPRAQQAIKDLLGADEISVFSAAAEVRPPLDFPQWAARGAGRPVGHVLWLDIGESGADPVRIRVWRRADAAPFSDGDVQMLSLLRRHLQIAGWLKSITHNDAFGCLAGTHLVRSMVKGLVIVDRDCQIRWHNPAAAEVLSGEDALSAGNGRLHARRAFETARLEALVRDAADGKPGVMLVRPQADKHPCGLAFAPLESGYGTGRPEADGRALVLVTIKQMQRQIERIADRLGELFGLTPAERRLGAHLLEGRSLQEAAQQENKALPTVKTQLRSMLKKTGAHSQVGLVNMFLSLPSIL